MSAKPQTCLKCMFPALKITPPKQPHYQKHQHDHKIIWLLFVLLFWGSVRHYRQGPQLKLTVKSQRLLITAHLMNHFQECETTQNKVDFHNISFTPWWICNVWYATEEHIPYLLHFSFSSHITGSSFKACLEVYAHVKDMAFDQKSKLTANRWQLSQLQVVTVSFRSERRLHPAVMNNDQDVTSFITVPLFPLLHWLLSERVSL